MRCPVCQSDSELFLNRAQVPVNQNIVFATQRWALEVPRDNLQLAVCNRCGFIFNQSFHEYQPMYGKDYDNTQTCSPLFSAYTNDLVKDLVNKGVRNCRVVEVGCGDGSFLRKLVEAGNEGYGFDPSYVGPMSALGGRLMFEKECYEVPVEADVVICRHVIEHLPDPIKMLRMIRAKRVFIETPNVEWILKNQVIWDFFYEHCSYFSIPSLTTALETVGFIVEDVSRVFGGQYLWVEARRGDVVISHRPGRVPALAREFALAEPSLLKALVDEIKMGNVALWGAGAKGVTLANLVDPECELISCVVDLNPRKQGGFIPGTGHPIVDYRELPKFGVKRAIVMNPNYRNECLALLYAAHLDVELTGRPEEGARCA